MFHGRFEGLAVSEGVRLTDILIKTAVGQRRLSGSRLRSAAISLGIPGETYGLSSTKKRQGRSIPRVIPMRHDVDIVHGATAGSAVKYRGGSVSLMPCWLLSTPNACVS